MPPERKLTTAEEALENHVARVHRLVTRLLVLRSVMLAIAVAAAMVIMVGGPDVSPFGIMSMPVGMVDLAIFASTVPHLATRRRKLVRYGQGPNYRQGFPVLQTKPERWSSFVMYFLADLLQTVTVGMAAYQLSGDETVGLASAALMLTASQLAMRQETLAEIAHGETAWFWHAVMRCAGGYNNIPRVD